MTGAFEQGTILWYWYDAWVAVPALVVAAALTLWVVLGTSWSQPVPLVAKTVAVLGTIPVAMVVLDRIGIYTAIGRPETFGYTSIVGAGIAVVIGLVTLLITRRGGAAPAPSVAATIGGLDTVTPEEGTDVTMLVEAEEEEGEMEEADETQAIPQDAAATIMVGGAGATQVIGPQAAPPAHLVVRSGPEEGQSFPIAEEETTLGRSSDNAIVLTDPTVSRHHARIVREGADYVIENLESAAGTIVDGAPVERQRLQSGNVLRLGETELVFEGPAGAVEEARTMAVPASAGASAAGATMVLGREEAPPTAWLLVRKGSEAGRSFGLGSDAITIGRTAESDIRLDDRAVSGSHALLRRVEGRYLVYDLGSSNGTLVNGEALTGAPLRDGSRIVLGQSELAFTPVTGGRDAPAAPGAGGQTMVLRPSESARGVLLVRSGPAAGQSLSLGDEDTIIGREPGPGGATINDPAVSRRHALVRRTPEGYAVYDLGSTGGTSVDGVTLTGRELKNGDVVQVGETELQFAEAAPS